MVEAEPTKKSRIHNIAFFATKVFRAGYFFSEVVLSTYRYSGSAICFQAVFRIRIRIRRTHMFLGLLDPQPDPLVRDTGTDPAPDLK
jgi:hypothetical protein